MSRNTLFSGLFWSNLLTFTKVGLPYRAFVVEVELKIHFYFVTFL